MPCLRILPTAQSHDLKKVPPPYLRACPAAAPGWRELMERCWAEDPEVRPSFRDILRELHAMGKELKDKMRRRRKQQPSDDPLPDLPEGGPPD